MCNRPASVSDQTIFDASSFAQNLWKFLKKHEEFIFTDLGFKKEVFTVPPYKGKEAKLEHNALFNKAQRGGRTKVLLVLVLILWNVTREQVEHHQTACKMVPLAMFANATEISLLLEMVNRLSNEELQTGVLETLQTVSKIRALLACWDSHHGQTTCQFSKGILRSC